MVLAAVVALVAIVGRVLGPSGLYQNTDECKTVAFTADMLAHGRWLVPIDMAGAPALKPPLVNWLAAPCVAVLGPTELAHKLPLIGSALAAAAVVGACAAWLLSGLGGPPPARGLPPDDVDRAMRAHAVPLGVATGAAWLSAPDSVKQLYFCRPDGVQNLFLALAFFAITRAVLGSTHTGRWALLGWVAAGLAALAKGPMALLVPVYAVAIALVQTPRRAALSRLGFLWGLPIMLVIPCFWLVPAWVAEPDHVGQTLLGGEVAARFSTEGDNATISQIPMNLIRVPAFYVERFPPWALLAVLGLVLVARRGLLRHALGPAVLWVALLTAALVVMAGESGSFNAPAYPALAILATYAFVRAVAQGRISRVGAAAPLLATLALLTVCLVVAREAFFSRAAATGLGEEVAEFASRAREHVGDEQVAFLNPDHHNPVRVLMGRHQAAAPDQERTALARWVVGPPALVLPGKTLEPELQSDGLRRTKAGGRGNRPDVPPLVLYRVAPAGP